MAFLLLASVCSLAYGQQKAPVLGESPFEVERKCGKGSGLTQSGVTYETATYEPTGYRFAVVYQQKRVVCFRLKKTEPPHLSDEDIALVLSANSHFKERWDTVPADGPKLWKRADGGAWAVKYDIMHELVVMESRYAEKNDEFVKRTLSKSTPTPTLVE